jgi:signal transduction histidine kinase
MTGIHTDVTKQRITAKRLDQSSRALETASTALELAMAGAEAGAQAKSRFLANMSHEVRTPMTAILGYADLLRDGCASRELLDEALGAISENGRRLMELIDDVLEISDLETGRLVLKSEPVRLDDILKRLRRAVRPKAARKGLYFRIRRDPRLPEWIRTDPDRLASMLVNLTENAVKFTERGGVRVVLRPGGEPSGRWSPGAEESGRLALRISVVDTGIGIDASRRDEIFLPFTQADGSTTRLHGGAGLGLTVSRGLARMMGGDVTVESRPGTGSRFHLVLPVETVPVPRRAVA